MNPNTSTSHGKPGVTPTPAEQSILPDISKSTDVAPSGRSIPKAVFCRDLLGYAHLCCEVVRTQKSTLELSDFTSPVELLKGIAEKAQVHDLPKGKLEFSSREIEKILNGSGIRPELWNEVIRKVGRADSPRALLDDAVRRGKAVSLGLPEDASPGLVEVERRLFVDQFDLTEEDRIFTNMCLENPSEWKSDTGDIVLHGIRTKANYDIPQDGFETYSFKLGWFLKTALVKGWASTVTRLMSTFTEVDECFRSMTENRSWLAPDPESVKSPTIQRFLSNLRKAGIEVDVKVVPDNAGALLDFEFRVTDDYRNRIKEGRGANT